MNRCHLFISILVLFYTHLCGQQLPNSTHIGEARSTWNPAFTANGSDLIFDGFFRMQMMGFSGAPVSGFISFQYPLVKYNMSGGAILLFDKTGPISKTGLQLNYAYKMKQFLNKYGQLSLGISGSFQQYTFNGSNQVFNDQDDPIISNNRTGKFYPSVGGGFFYTSNTRAFKGNTFFTGFAINQIYTSRVIINDFDQVRQRHYHFNIGGRFNNYDTYIEPMITANIVNPDLIDVLYSLKFEQEDTFWAGLGYASSGMMALQGGIIKKDVGNRYSRLRIGGLATYGISSTIAKVGPGFEFYIAYHFDMK